MSVGSIVGRALFSKPILGDYELVQAMSAIAVSMADKKSKMDPKYWTRGIAVNIQNRNGQKFRIQTRQPLVLGPFLARCILEPGAAQMAPQVPADP